MMYMAVVFAVECEASKSRITRGSGNSTKTIHVSSIHRSAPQQANGTARWQNTASNSPTHGACQRVSLYTHLEETLGRCGLAAGAAAAKSSRCWRHDVFVAAMTRGAVNETPSAALPVLLPRGCLLPEGEHASLWRGRAQNHHGIGCWVIFRGGINGNLYSILTRNAAPNYHCKPSQSQPFLRRTRVTYKATDRNRDGPLPRARQARSRRTLPPTGVWKRPCGSSSFGCSNSRNNSSNNRNNSSFFTGDESSSCCVYWERQPSSCHVGRNAHAAHQQRPPWTERVQSALAGSESAAGTATDDDSGAAGISPSGTGG